MAAKVARIPANGPAYRYPFWNNVIDPIPGWLHRPAAIHTMDLLDCQDTFGVTGALLEIGVYYGKFFTILARHACQSRSMAVGIDPFSLLDIETAREHIAPAVTGDGSNIMLLRAYSCEFDVRQIVNMLGTPARFISIDGSHEKADVYYDLCVAEQVLAGGGIIAVDDFLNYVTPGVNEAVFEFFSSSRRVVPFAFIKNKLFLSIKTWAHRFRTMLETKLIADDVEEHSNFFRYHLAQNRALVEAQYWGSPVLLAP